MYMTLMAPILTIIMMLMALKMIMKTMTKNKSNKTPFECGFSKMMNMSKFPLSIQFFTLSIMFIIFDIEISVLLNMVTPIKTWNIGQWGPPSLIFVMTMMASIMYEWNESAMYWTK